MPSVKTAVSLEKSLFRGAEKLARRMRLSRSKLVALALERLLRAHEQEELICRISEAYAEPMDGEERAFVKGSAASPGELTKDDEWLCRTTYLARGSHDGRKADDSERMPPGSSAPSDPFGLRAKPVRQV